MTLAVDSFGWSGTGRSVTFELGPAHRMGRGVLGAPLLAGAWLVFVLGGSGGVGCAALECTWVGDIISIWLAGEACLVSMCRLWLRIFAGYTNACFV